MTGARGRALAIPLACAALFGVSFATATALRDTPATPPSARAVRDVAPDVATVQAPSLSHVAGLPGLRVTTTPQRAAPAVARAGVVAAATVATPRRRVVRRAVSTAPARSAPAPSSAPTASVPTSSAPTSSAPTSSAPTTSAPAPAPAAPAPAPAQPSSGGSFFNDG